MEKPRFTYENLEFIEADTKEEALDKYYKIHPRDYWFARVIGIRPDTEEFRKPRGED